MAKRKSNAALPHAENKRKDFKKIKKQGVDMVVQSRIQKIVIVCLIMTCLVSAAMATTLAWRDYTQHKSNEFKGLKLPEFSYAFLEKFDKDTEAPLEGFEFELYKVVENGDDILIGTYITNEDGVIRSDRLEAGDYYWLETGPVFGWTWDKDDEGVDIRKYPFTAEEGDNNTIFVQAYNKRQYADLIITKTVVDLNASEPPGDSPAGSEAIDNIGAGSSGSAAASKNKPSTAPIGALGVGGDAGSKMPSAVSENKENLLMAAEATEEPTLTALEESPALDEEPGSDENADPGDPPILDEPPESTEPPKLDDPPKVGDPPAMDEPVAPVVTASALQPAQLNQIFEFTVTFVGIDDGPVTVLIDGVETIMTIVDGKLTIYLKHGQTAVIKNLPVGTEYSVQEKPVPGYIGHSDNAAGVIPPGGITAAFTNYYGGDEPGKLIVKKIVTGTHADREKEFRFKVIIGDEEVIIYLKHGEERDFVLPPGTEWAVIEDDYTGDGYESSGRVTIRLVDGVIVVELVQTNHYTEPPDVEIEIEGEKTWDLSGENVTLPEYITVILKDGDVVVDMKIVRPDANGKWRYKFIVPKYRADGTTEIVYTIEELPIPGFIPTITGYNILNKYTPVPPAVVVVPSVKKIITGNPSEKVTFEFKLIAQGNAPMPPGSTNGEKTISIVGAGEATFGQIQYTQAGTYHYTIAEVLQNKAGWTYDVTVYTLTVVVTEHNRVLTAERTLVKMNGEKAGAKAEFTNKYKKPTEPPDKPKPPVEPPDKPKPPGEPTKPVTPTRPVTGDASNIWMWAIMLIVSALALRVLMLYQRPAKGKQD